MDLKKAFYKTDLDFSGMDLLLDLNIEGIDPKYLIFNKKLNDKLSYPITVYGNGSRHTGYLKLGFRLKQDRTNGFVASNGNPKMYTSISYDGKNSVINNLCKKFEWEKVDSMEVKSFRLMGAEEGTLILNEPIDHSYLRELCNYLRDENICKSPRLDLSYASLTPGEFSQLRYGKAKVKNIGILNNTSKRESRSYK